MFFLVKQRYDAGSAGIVTQATQYKY